MNLTGQTTIRTYYTLDPDTNILTIEIKDEADVLLDTIIIENTKYRSLMKAMALMSEERVTSLMEQIGFKVSYDIQSEIGVIKFG
jgi:hypothetical protein